MSAQDQTAPTLQALQASLAAIEANLARSRRQLADAQQLARIGSWEWDIPANEVWWSGELYRIYALEPDAIKPDYERFLSFVHPDDRASVDERNRRAFADHQPFEDVKRVVRADGREILMRTQGEVVCDADGNPLRMVGICEDVTESRQAQRTSEPRESALELNDSVVLPLAEAAQQLARGEVAQASAMIDQARRSALRIAQELVGVPASAPAP